MTIRKLRDTDLASVNYREDTRGAMVVDSDGRRLGRVQSLFLDEREKKIRMLLVASDTADDGWIVPIDSIAQIVNQTVRLNCPKRSLMRVAEGSSVPADLDWDAVYRRYGYEPFWSDGYAYPPYPFFT